MKNKNKVLACVDQSRFAAYVAWAIRRMDTSLEFLHVIDRHTPKPGLFNATGQRPVEAERVVVEASADVLYLS